MKIIRVQNYKDFGLFLFIASLCYSQDIDKKETDIGGRVLRLFLS